MPPLRAIVSIAGPWAIGKQGQLPCRNSEDLKRFKELTLGSTVIMGRKTLDTLPGGRALPGRRNIVLTRDDSFEREGVEVAHGISQVLTLVARDPAVWVIGGESVYRAFLPYCTEVMVTRHQMDLPGADTYFPNLDELPGWYRSVEGPLQHTPEGIAYRYEVYKNAR